MSTVHDRASDSRDHGASEAGPEPIPDDASNPAYGIDPLSDALRTVRLKGALFFLWEPSLPFVTPVPRGECFAPVILPGTRQIVSYHILLEGSCWGARVGETPLRLRAGDIFLVPRGDAYVMTSSEEACRRVDIDEIAAVEFFRQMAAGELPFVVREGGGGETAARVVCGFLGLDAQPFNPVVSALPAAARLRASAAPEDDRLQRLVEYAVAEARSPGPGSHCTLTRLSELLFVEVIRRFVGQLTEAPHGWLAGLQDPVVARCLTLMHRRPAEPWTLAILAEHVGCSRSRLAERFVGRIGDPPIRYLTRWRMQLASHLLEGEHTSIEAVAHRVGYGSGPAFSRAFKRTVGVSPSDWRESGRGPSPRTRRGAGRSSLRTPHC